MPFIVLDSSTAQAAPDTALGAPLEGTGLSLLDMREELVTLWGNREDVDGARVDRWINQAYLDLATMIKLPDLLVSLQLPLVASQPLYILPDVVFALVRVSVLDEDYENYEGRLLEQVSVDGYRKLVTDEGMVSRYFRQGSLLGVWPTPDQMNNLALEFYMRPQPLVEDTDCSILPREWDEAILLGARYRGFDSLMEWENASVAENRYLQFIARRQDRAQIEEGNEVPSRVIKSSTGRYRNPRLPRTR